MPFELYLLWRQYPWDFGELVCDAKVLTQETITYSSIFTILAFTVERYLAICHPLSIPRKSKMVRAIRVIAVVWISSVSFSIPWIFYNKVSRPYESTQYIPKMAVVFSLKTRHPSSVFIVSSCMVQSAAIARSQGLVKRYCGSSSGRWAILQLMCSQARRKLQEGLPQKLLAKP